MIGGALPNFFRMMEQSARRELEIAGEADGQTKTIVAKKMSTLSSF